MSELRYWIWFSSLRGIGARSTFELLEHFGSPEAVYFAREQEYAAVIKGDISPLLNKSMTASRRIIAECDDKNINILTIADGGYPTRLKNIFDPPLVLYVKGRLPAVDEEAAVAIVGTRSCTPYGIVTAERIGYEVAYSGGLVVSGLARGIDSAAVRGALRAGGKVIGVLGCGIDIVYPASNRQLFDDVSQTGAIISEYPPGTPPEKHNFPARNRILSGISVGVAVVEAPERSGALITASLALEQGRDVFAVPGNVDSVSCRGSNGLLREGAMAALSGWDITEMYEAVFPEKLSGRRKVRPQKIEASEAEKLVEKELKEAVNRQKATKKVFDNTDSESYIDIIVNPDELTDEEKAILSVLDTCMHVDEIIEKTGLEASKVLSALTMLEINGAVSQEAGKRFVPHFKFEKETEKETFV
ncbi:MAG: DNA-processing protein DprA [Oscillospiraceae bacterium]